MFLRDKPMCTYIYIYIYGAGNSYRDLYYKRNPTLGTRIIMNLRESPYTVAPVAKAFRTAGLQHFFLAAAYECRSCAALQVAMRAGRGTQKDPISISLNTKTLRQGYEDPA